MRPLSVTGLAMLFVGLSYFAPLSQGQVLAPDLAGDPFSLYFGFFLPRQTAQALQPRPIDRIVARDQAREARVFAEREALYDPIFPFGSTSDIFQSENRRPIAVPRVPGLTDLNRTGLGPPGYFGRVLIGSINYFPEYPGTARGQTQRSRPLGLGGSSQGPSLVGGQGNINPAALGLPNLPIGANIPLGF